MKPVLHCVLIASAMLVFSCTNALSGIDEEVAVFGEPVSNPTVESYLPIIQIKTVDGSLVFRCMRDHDSGSTVFTLRVSADLDVSDPNDADAEFLRSTWNPDLWQLCFRAARLGAASEYSSSCAPLSGPHIRDTPVWLPREGLTSDSVSSVAVESWLSRLNQAEGHAVSGDIGKSSVFFQGGQSTLPGQKANITAFMWGGLGNQLYIIFATIAYALRHDLNFHFDNSEDSISPIYRPRKTYWSILLSALQKNLVDSATMTGSKTLNIYADDATGSYLELPSPPLEISKHITVHWQINAIAHFDDEAPAIVELLELRSKRDSACGILRSLVPGVLGGDVPIISLHFRIGDLKELEGMLMLPDEYYVNAVKRVLKDAKLSFAYVLCFCEPEDMLTVEARVQELRGAVPEVEFHLVPGWVADFMQLLLMSCCDHHVIANSSFSFWAAYFHRIISRERSSQNIVVAYPKYYSVPLRKRKFHDQYYPPSWTSVEFTSEGWQPQDVDRDKDMTSIMIAFPPDGSVVSAHVTPLVQVVVGSDETGEEIKSSVAFWDLCIEIDLGAVSDRLCYPLSKPAELPVLPGIHPGGTHQLVAYLCGHRDTVEETKVAEATSTFTAEA